MVHLILEVWQHILFQENAFENVFAKCRPFCPGLNVLPNMDSNVEFSAWHKPQTGQTNTENASVTNQQTIITSLFTTQPLAR